jgi:hypothetical protein
MINKNIAMVLALSLNMTAFAQEADNQKKVKTILSLNSPDEVLCNGKVFNQHIFKLTVTQDILENDELDTSKSRIYEDGVLKGICKEAVKVNRFNKYSEIFTDLKIINSLSVDELTKLFRSTSVGYCSYDYRNLSMLKSGGMFASKKFSLDELINEKAIELENNDRVQVLSEVLKDLVKSKKCGSFGNEIVKETKNSNLKKLALANVGFDYLMDAKTTKTEFLKAGFNAKTLQKEFKITLQEFKLNNYSADSLHEAGFSSLELYNVGYSLEDLNGNSDLKELKNIVSVEKFVKAGFRISQLKSIGYNEIIEIKPYFTIQDFETTYRNDGTVKQLQRLGFSAKEIKNIGYGIAALKNAGFNEIREIKPLFTITDFEYYYRNDDTANQLKRLGYSIVEIKKLGYGIAALKNIGFDEIKEIKPLFTIQDFEYHYRNNDIVGQLKRLGYSIVEIKNLGYGIAALKNSGFDEIKEIKTLFTIKDFEYYYRNEDTSRQLKRLGYSIVEIKKLGYGIAALKNIGFDEITEIKPLFTIKDFEYYYRNENVPSNLKRLQFTRQEVKALGYGDASLDQAGF